MADKNIQEGDEGTLEAIFQHSCGLNERDPVEWKWGGGKPSGVVEEIKTDGQLEIKSKGKMVHKNASPENPAVHVGREGNDVVKRMSELETIGDGGGESQGKEGSGEETKVADDGSKDETAEQQQEKGDKTEKTKEGKGAEVGDKRERSADREKVSTQDEDKDSEKAVDGSKIDEEKSEPPAKRTRRQTKGAEKVEKVAPASGGKKGAAGRHRGVKHKNPDEGEPAQAMEGVHVESDGATAKSRN